MERKLILTYLVGCTSTFSISLWQPLLPLYLDLKGFNPWEIGLGVSMITNTAFLMAFIAGYVVDKIGCNLSLIFSQLIIILVTLSLIAIDNILLLIIISLCFGLALALINQSSVKMVVLSTELRVRGLAFSTYLTLVSIGRMIGCFLSGYIASYLGYTHLFLISSAFMLPTLIMLKHSSVREKVSRVNIGDVMLLISSDLRLKVIALTLFVHDFSVFISIPYLALFAKYSLGLGEREVGLLYGVNNLANMVSLLVSGRLADKIGGSLTLALHFIAVSASYILYSFVSDFCSALLVYGFMGVAVSLDLPARRILLTKYAPKEYVGAISGFADTLVGLGTLFSPLIGGYLWTINYSLPLIVGGLSNILSIPLILYLKVLKRKLDKLTNKKV